MNTLAGFATDLVEWDVRCQYARYLSHCAQAHMLPQSFVRFVADVFPYTAFSQR